MAWEGVRGTRVTIRTLDPAGTLRFYRDILGLSQGDVFASGAILTTDNLELAIIDQPGAGWEADGMVSLGFWVKDLEASYRQLLTNNCDLEPIVVKPWGSRQFVVRDPNGISILMMEASD